MGIDFDNKNNQGHNLLLEAILLVFILIAAFVLFLNSEKNVILSCNTYKDYCELLTQNHIGINKVTPIFAPSEIESAYVYTKNPEYARSNPYSKKVVYYLAIKNKNNQSIDIYKQHNLSRRKAFLERKEWNTKQILEHIANEINELLKGDDNIFRYDVIEHFFK